MYLQLIYCILLFCRLDLVKKVTKSQGEIEIEV